MRLLIVGELEGYLSKACSVARTRGCLICHVEGACAARDVLRGDVAFDLALVDDQHDIPSFAASLQKERISVPIVACGLGADAKHAVAAIKAGAIEYLPLPPDPEIIAALLQSAAEDSTTDLIYSSAVMRECVKTAEKIAASDASVLILGKSGTGKEVLARHIHKRSKRSQHPFIAVNCAAIPEALLESELFGYEKGAFSGATARRQGKFEQASGGTLLLDEISEMDLRLQVKLLRAIQEREIDRLGGSKPVKVDVRILATSNRDMAEIVAKKRFREDLYFRLNVISITLPPLRERVEDILLLAERFIEKYCQENALDMKELSPEAEAALMRYSWPGNVRELENVVHRAVLLGETPSLIPEDLSLQADSPPQSKATLRQKMVAVERETILDTFSSSSGDHFHAASILGISIRRLRTKLDQYANEGHAIPGLHGDKVS